MVVFSCRRFLTAACYRGAPSVRPRETHLVNSIRGRGKITARPTAAATFFPPPPFPTGQHQSRAPDARSRSRYPSLSLRCPLDLAPFLERRVDAVACGGTTGRERERPGSFRLTTHCCLPRAPSVLLIMLATFPWLGRTRAATAACPGSGLGSWAGGGRAVRRTGRSEGGCSGGG